MIIASNFSAITISPDAGLRIDAIGKNYNKDRWNYGNTFDRITIIFSICMSRMVW